MKPQARIEKTQADDQPCFVISRKQNGETEQVDQQFASYQQALEFILEQGWQLKRESPSNSLHVETRFLKP